MTAKTTVLADIREYLVREGVAGATDVAPGMLVTDTTGTIAPHASSGAKPTTIRVAIESVGATGGGVDVLYTATGETVPYYIALSGDQLNLALAVSQTIANGDSLTSAGNGYWKKVGSGDTAIAVAREAVTTSSSQHTLITAEVL